MAKRIRPYRIKPFGNKDETRPRRFGGNRKDDVVMVKAERIGPQLDDLAPGRTRREW